MHTKHLACAGCLLLLCTLTGCADEEDAPGSTLKITVEPGEGDENPYGTQRDVVVGDEDTYIVEGETEDGSCVMIEEACVNLEDSRERYCDEEGAQADFVVIDGEVVDIICYPAPEGGTAIEEVAQSEEGSIRIPQNKGGSVIVFNEDTNGEAFEGDVTIDAERTSLYGNGVDETIIDGNLTVASNQSRVRGVTVTGDVVYERNANNSALAFSKIHGSLTVHSNSTTLIDCQVFGDVTVSGNNATLINIGVAGMWTPGKFEVCHGCYTFEDSDDDGTIADDERGDTLCTMGEQP